MVLKGIINITQSSPLAKLTVLTIVGIPTIMTISMHGYALADGEPGYQLTVNVPSYPSGTSTLGISITTANGYTDHANLATSSGTSWTFNIPANQGSSVRVCVNSDSSSGEHCNTYDTTSTDMSVSLSPPSGNSYYISPGNTYYIYPGNSYGYYHHDRDHWFGGGHENGRDHWFGGHQDSGNIGNGVYGGHRDTGNIGNSGNQNSGNIGSGNNGFGGHQDSGNNGGHQNSGNIGNGGNQNNGNNGVGGYGGHQDSGNKGFGGHQDHWLGGHQDSGNIGSNKGFGSHQESSNHGITEPADHLHHLSKGAPMMNAESSDDDSDFS
jgi:hypothetical protein